MSDWPDDPDIESAVAAVPSLAPLVRGLNRQQALAVIEPPGPVQIVAGPGSGKTLVLTRRVAKLVAVDGASPDRILCVTFTNKAAGELVKRLSALMDRRVGRWTGTFHSACGRLLRLWGGAVGVRRDFTVYAEAESRDALRAVICEMTAASLGAEDPRREEPAWPVGGWSVAAVLEVVASSGSPPRTIGVRRLPGEKTRMADLAGAPAVCAWCRSPGGNVLLVGRNDAMRAVHPSCVEAAIGPSAAAKAARIVAAMDDVVAAAPDEESHDVDARRVTEAVRQYSKWIDRDKNMGITAEARAARLGRTPLYAEVYARYQAKLAASNALDFGDMILKMVELVRNPEIGDEVRSLFDHVLVDEYQDTSPIQHALVMALMPARGRSVTVVGDDDQCVPGSEMVWTPRGSVRMEDIKVGDEVLSYRGGARVVGHVSAKSMTGVRRSVRFAVEGGGSFRVTDGHVCFSSLGDPGGAYVYVMHREDLGFRIGVSSTPKGKHLVMRTQQEHAGRMWIVAWHPDYATAAEHEAILSLRYRIPREPFVGRPGTWGSERPVGRLFREFGGNGRSLLDEMGHDFDRPNYMVKASRHAGRVAVNLRAAARRGHSVEVELSANKVPVDIRARFGFVTGKRGTVRLRRLFRAYPDASRFADALAEALPGYVAEHLSDTPCARRCFAVRAASIHRNMLVPVIASDGGIAMASIVGRGEEDSEEACYDIEVEPDSNFIVGSARAVVHNSVYSFRAADVRNVLNFERETGARVFRLERNYRSTGTIVRASSSLIAHNTDRIDKDLRTENEVGPPLAIRIEEDEMAEAAFVAREIRRAHAPGSLDLADFAVLYRTGAQSVVLERELRAFSVPYRIVGGTSFYEREEIRDAVAFLRVGAYLDEVALNRIINVPPRGVGNKLRGEIDAVAADDGQGLWQAVLKVGSWRRRSRQMKAMRSLIDAVEGTQRAVRGPLDKMLAVMLQATGYRAALQRTADEAEKVDDREEAIDRLENLGELESEVSRFVAEHPDGTLSEWLESVALMSGEREDGDAGDAVQLMTVHKSKGLEFPCVFIVGAEHGIFPHRLALAEADGQADGGVPPGGIAEERRLFYVAMTRTKRRLWITRAEARTVFGRRASNQASVFIAEALSGKPSAMITHWRERGTPPPSRTPGPTSLPN